MTPEVLSLSLSLTSLLSWLSFSLARTYLREGWPGQAFAAAALALAAGVALSLFLREVGL